MAPCLTMPNHDPYLAWSTTCPVSVSPKRPLTLIDDLQALGMPVVHRLAEGTEVPAWHPVDTSVGALRMLVRDALHQAVSERIYTNKAWSRPAWRSAGCARSSGRHGKPRCSLRSMSTVPAGPRKFSRAGSTGRASSALPDQLHRGRPIDTTSPHVLQQKTVTCPSRPSCSHLGGAVFASLSLAFWNLKRSKCRVAFSGCLLRHRRWRSLVDKAISALLYT